MQKGECLNLENIVQKVYSRNVGKFWGYYEKGGRSKHDFSRKFHQLKHVEKRSSHRKPYSEKSDFLIFFMIKFS